MEGRCDGIKSAPVIVPILLEDFRRFDAFRLAEDIKIRGEPRDFNDDIVVVALLVCSVQAKCSPLSTIPCLYCLLNRIERDELLAADFPHNGQTVVRDGSNVLS